MTRREALNLTRAELAGVLSVAESTVWRWEHDRVFPLRKISDIATALDTTVSHLLGEDA